MYFSYQPDKYGEKPMTDFDSLMNTMLEKANQAFQQQKRDRSISHVIDLMRYCDNVDEALKIYAEIDEKLPIEGD